KCKKCGKYGFYDVHEYAAHYEACSPGKKKQFDVSSVGTMPLHFDPEKPSMEWGKKEEPLKAIPENIGNEMRPCPFCKSSFSPAQLLLHQKEEHSLEHFTNAPYKCGCCDEVGFYSHADYAEHGTKCTGVSPVHLHNNIYAITSEEVENRTGAKRIEIPSYRALISEERRKHGTFTSFNRPHTCPMCHVWCSSLKTLGHHFKDSHDLRNENLRPFLCGGCGVVFAESADLKVHLIYQENLGNMQCFDMATTHSNPTNRISDVKNANGQNVVQSTSQIRYVTKAPPSLPQFPSIRPLTSSAVRKPTVNPDLPYAKFVETPTISLSRLQAAEKRFNSYGVPLRRVSQLSKSPLSGERHQETRRKIQANRLQAQSIANCRQMASNGTLHSTVDFSSPLSNSSFPRPRTEVSPNETLPSPGPSFSRRLTINQFEALRNQKLRSTGQPASSSFSTSPDELRLQPMQLTPMQLQQLQRPAVL
ncbi:hypothetical protein PFISCL1PPCAC_26601, partial [Pristionchus fissidentatus]